MTAPALGLPAEQDVTGRAGAGMGAALRTELRKLTTTRTWWVLGTAGG